MLLFLLGFVCLFVCRIDCEGIASIVCFVWFGSTYDCLFHGLFVLFVVFVAFGFI